jgi:hypothetical protein
LRAIGRLALGSPTKLGSAIFTLLALLLAGLLWAEAQDSEKQHADQANRHIDSEKVCFPPQADTATQRPTPPQRIKVGKIVYTVKVVKDPPAWGEYGISFSGKTCDRTPPEKGGCKLQNHIFIEAGRTLKEEQTTLVHELQHALLGIELSDRKTTYHDFIYKLSPKLLEVLQENPDLYAYLAASESNITSATK